MRLFCVALLCLAAACHDHDHGSYPTYQACYDEHTNVESLPVNEAIVVCCLDHPVDGVSEVCGASAADCVTYLTSNLSGPTSTEISAACDEYAFQKGM